MSRSKRDVYRSLPLILSGTRVEFTLSYAFAEKRLNYTLSYDFETFKGMSHNLELLSFQKMHGLLGFIRKMEARSELGKTHCDRICTFDYSIRFYDDMAP